MSRRPRLDAPDTYHHGYSRGVLGTPLFVDDADRRIYLALAERVLRETGTGCCAWSLMTNHTRLGPIAGPLGLSKPVAQLNSCFARSLNRRHGEKGHVFQHPFGSRRVGDQGDLVGLVGYIHLNAVRAGLDEQGENGRCRRAWRLGT